MQTTWKMEYQIKVIILISVSLSGNAVSQLLGTYRGAPDKCVASHSVLDARCCIFPPFFVRDIARKCGIFSVRTFANKEFEAVRRTIATCEQWSCVYRAYHIIGPYDTVDENKFFAHLDKWVELNPTFKSVMDEAKKHCHQAYMTRMPIKACYFHRGFGTCIRKFVETDCPDWVNSDVCRQQKDFYQECREFYI